MSRVAASVKLPLVETGRNDMKWIVGGLILAVVASVVSGRVPVAWVVYSFALMFGCWGLALFLPTRAPSTMASCCWALRFLPPA